jgi:hypothetical protein
MADSEGSLRVELEMLERVAARVEGQRPEDRRLLQAISTLIAEKRRQLDYVESRRESARALDRRERRFGRVDRRATSRDRSALARRRGLA